MLTQKYFLFFSPTAYTLQNSDTKAYWFLLLSVFLYVKPVQKEPEEACMCLVGLAN